MPVAAVHRKASNTGPAVDGLYPAMTAPSPLTPRAMLWKVPPGKSPRPTMPEPAVHRNASFPGAVLESLFAGNRQLLEQNTPSQYIPSMTFTQSLSMLLVAGTEDPQLPTARQLYAQLKARNSADLDVALQVVPGATHTWHGATMDSPYGYVFFSDRVKATAGTSGG